MSNENDHDKKKLGWAGGAIGAFLTAVAIAVVTSDKRPWWLPIPSPEPSLSPTAVLSPPPAPPPPTPEQRYTVRWQSDGFAVVREKATTASSEVGRFRPGTVIYCGDVVEGELGSQGNLWRYCKKAGGYIYASLLTKVSD